MKTSINLNKTASAIADMIKQGVDIQVYREKDLILSWHIAVCDPSTGNAVHLTFNATEPVALPAPKTQCAVPKKKSTRWWSRFNFEKNIMKMTLLALQDRYPAEEGFPQKMFAERLASMMHWEISTARRHITQAAKMGIINRAVIGTVYHITGVNDVDEQAAREEVADREQAPEEMPLPFDDLDDEDKPAPRSALAEEGRPLFEQQLEKAIDETLLP